MCREEGLIIVGISNNAGEMFGQESSSMLMQPLLGMFEESQRIESALTMKDLSLANPITVTIKKPDTETSRVRRSHFPKCYRVAKPKKKLTHAHVLAEFDQGELDRPPMQWPLALRCGGAAPH